MLSVAIFPNLKFDRLPFVIAVWFLLASRRSSKSTLLLFHLVDPLDAAGCMHIACVSLCTPLPACVSTLTNRPFRGISNRLHGTVVRCPSPCMSFCAYLLWHDTPGDQVLTVPCAATCPWLLSACLCKCVEMHCAPPDTYACGFIDGDCSAGRFFAALLKLTGEGSFIR